MKISDMLRSGAKPFPSLEIVPPQSGIGKEELLESIVPLMEFAPRYINVTTHRDEVRFDPQPDGSYQRRIVRNRVSAVAVCAAIQSRYDVEVVPHLICGGTPAYETEALLQDFKFMGIENVMALRGDSLTGEKRFTPDPAGYAHANELVSAIRSFERLHRRRGLSRKTFRGSQHRNRYRKPETQGRCGCRRRHYADVL